MPDPRPAAVLLKKVWRIGHAFHPACNHHIGAARCERFCAHDDRLHSAAADFVDGGGLDRFGKASLDRSLASRGLTQSGRQNAAHIGPVEILACNARALNRCFHRCCAKVRRLDSRERTLHPAHWRACVGENDNRIIGRESGHGSVSLVW